MELEKSKSAIKGQAVSAKAAKPSGDVSNLRKESKNSDISKQEIPSIRLTPEQIEEIHADEYSLTLFYATRVEPLSLNDIKREFPEPEPKKAQSVLDRFVKVGLVHITPDGAYYSNYPENYINYSHYRYDGDLEARKDSKVFQLMKEYTGKSEYWRDKTYFSMDAFYSKEQTEELLEMFKAIKLKAKEFANENARKKSIRGLRFRRMKFYDMTFMLLVVLFLGFGMPSKSFAGGNDPVAKMLALNPAAGFEFLSAARFAGGGGNDPTGVARSGNLYYAALRNVTASDSGGGGGHDPDTNSDGGGGHDPGGPGSSGTPSCYLELEGQVFAVKSARVCKLKRLIEVMSRCGDSNHPKCVEAEQQADLLLQKIEKETQSE